MKITIAMDLNIRQNTKIETTMAMSQIMEWIYMKHDIETIITNNQNILLIKKITSKNIQNMEKTTELQIKR